MNERVYERVASFIHIHSKLLSFKDYKAINEQAETYKPVSLGKWESDLSAIMPEPCIDFLGAGDEEQAISMVKANSYRGQESATISQVQNH